MGGGTQRFGIRVVTLRKVEFGKFTKMCATFSFNKMELIVPTMLTSQDIFRISVYIMHKKTLQIVYYTQQGIVLKFMVLYLGSGQVADLIFFFFF